MPHVSVIVPAYDGGGRLRAAVRSVLGQTYRDFELVVVDDGGHEDLSWLREHSDPRITLLRQPNAGVSAARNAAVRQSSGQWLAFLDQDDEWLPTKLDRQVRELTGVVLSHTDFLWAGRYNDPGRHEGPITRKALLRGGHYCLSSLIAERQAFCSVGGFDTGLAMQQDYALALRLLTVGRAAHIPEVLVRYVVHDGNASNDYWKTYRERLRVIRSERLPAERLDARAGLLDARRLYGREAVQAFRRSRSPRDLARAFWIDPRETGSVCFRRAAGR